MAGDHDRDRIPAVGQPDCPRRRRLADPPGKLTVGNGLAIWNVAKPGPYGALEPGAVQAQRQVKAGQLAREISAELAGGSRENLVVLNSARLAEPGRAGIVPAYLHVQAGQPAVVSHQGQRAYRALDYGMRHSHDSFLSICLLSCPAGPGS